MDLWNPVRLIRYDCYIIYYPWNPLCVIELEISWIFESSRFTCPLLQMCRFGVIFPTWGSDPLEGNTCYEVHITVCSDHPLKSWQVLTWPSPFDLRSTNLYGTWDEVSGEGRRLKLGIGKWYYLLLTPILSTFT